MVLTLIVTATCVFTVLACLRRRKERRRRAIDAQLLFRQVLRLANFKRASAVDESWDFQDKTRFPDFDAYRREWGPVIDQFLTHWRSASFLDDVWTAARVVHYMTRGKGSGELDSTVDQRTRSFILFKRMVGQEFPKYGLCGQRVYAELVDDNHGTTSANDAATNASVSWKLNDNPTDDWALCCFYAYTDDENTEPTTFAPSWTRRAIELAAHEFRHVLLHCGVGVPHDGYSNDSDSPWEIDARLFQRLVFETAADLAVIAELDGNTPFGPPVGPPLQVDGIHPQAQPYFVAAEALKHANEREKRETGFTFFSNSLALIAEYSAACAQRIRIIDVELTAPEVMGSPESVRKIECDLSQMIGNGGVSECECWGKEWLGYLLKRLAAHGSAKNTDTRLQAENAIQLFCELLVRTQDPRYFKYALQTAVGSGIMSAYTYTYYWRVMGLYLFDRWDAFFHATDTYSNFGEVHAAAAKRIEWQLENMASHDVRLGERDGGVLATRYIDAFKASRIKLSQLLIGHDWHVKQCAEDATLNVLMHNLNMQLPYEDWLRCAAGNYAFNCDRDSRPRVASVLALGQIYTDIVAHIEQLSNDPHVKASELEIWLRAVITMSRELTACQEYIVGHVEYADVRNMLDVIKSFLKGDGNASM